MTTFKDVFKKSFIEGFSRYDMTPENILIVFAISAIFSVYIFIAYRILTRKTFYSKNFNISLAIINLITAGIILTMQSNVVVSLGMVGALSIVRFRNAVKDPMDLVFLFWSISCGIITGAGQAEIAFALSFIVTVTLIVFEKVPVAKAAKILMVSGEGYDIEEKVSSVCKKYCSNFTTKSCSLANSRTDLVIEVKSDKDEELLKEVASIQNVSSSSLLKHDGEVTY